MLYIQYNTTLVLNTATKYTKSYLHGCQLLFALIRKDDLNSTFLHVFQLSFRYCSKQEALKIVT